jgi:CRP-like cAMP-binding protein
MAISGVPVLTPIVNKLMQHSKLNPAEVQAVLTLPCHLANMSAGAYLMREGDRVESCIALLSGFIYRNKIAGNGARQILSIHLTGDLIDLYNELLNVSDHSVQTLTYAEVAIIPRRAISDICQDFPNIAQALWRETLVDRSMLREWLLNIGRRDARQRIAHLFCELVLRQEAAGLCEGPVYELPMTQEQIGDATGLTSVHVNRTIQGMRIDGFITTTRRSITILEWQLLQMLGDFSSDYLHLPSSSANRDLTVTLSRSVRGRRTSPS